MMTTLLFISFCYVVIIWFIHKASVYFHRMDEKVGNTDKKENWPLCNDSLDVDTSAINNYTSMSTEDLQSVIAGLKSQISTEETRYFDGIKNNEIIEELKRTEIKIEELKYDLKQKMEMLSLQ